MFATNGTMLRITIVIPIVYSEKTKYFLIPFHLSLNIITLFYATDSTILIKKPLVKIVFPLEKTYQTFNPHILYFSIISFT